jgi:predicted NBD/HSP70 family sugar kinase
MALRRGRAGHDSGTNLSRVKDFNEMVVLDLVRGSGPVGRPAVAATTGLTLQTVSNIVRRLLEADVVAEVAAPAGRADGRQRRLVRVNPDGAYSLGIHLVRGEVTAGVVDLAGEIRGRSQRPFDRHAPLDRVMTYVSDAAGDAMSAAGVPRERIAAAGIGVPGPLDLRDGALLNILTPSAWSHFRVRDAVAEAIGMRVIMDNDATAAAMGERWRGAGMRTESFIYVYLGTGIGAGLVLGGQAHRGVRGNGGEISHTQVDERGPACDCGSRGCLGLYVSPAGLLREARREALAAPPSRPLPDPPETLEQLVASTEPAYGAVVDRAGHHLARVVCDLSGALDPELIVLGGPLAGTVGARFAACIERRLEQRSRLQGAPPPGVVLSQIGSDAGVLGAATLVLHDLFAPAAHRLALAGPPPGADAVQAG